MNPCKLYPRKPNASGYGYVYTNYLCIPAHRYYWEQTHGEIPKGAFVVQTCGNRQCVELSHLKLRYQGVRAVLEAIKEETNECIKGWGPNSNGRATLFMNGKVWIASRIAYTLAHDDPGDMLVLHRCDDPICINPRHLFLGTASDNMRDMVSKGRGVWQIGKRRRGPRTCIYGKEWKRAHVAQYEPRREQLLELAYALEST